jgi:peroxiredoxin
VRINDTAPDFELPDLDGGMHKLSDYRGQVVILNFWSCECPHVERTDELIADWCEQKWGRYVSLLRVASNATESTSVLKEAAVRKSIPVLLVDHQLAVADQYAAQTTPQVFVISDTGRLRSRGAVDDTSFARREPTRFYLEEAVDAVLSGKTPPVSETQPFGCAIIRQALE